MTGVYIDDTATNVLDEQVTFPGGTAGQSPVTKTVEGFEAEKSIKLTFDNSNITTSEVDSKGKNKQLFASVIFKYKKVETGINEIKSQKFAITSNGKTYTLDGKLTAPAQKGKVYIKNGKKFVK